MISTHSTAMAAANGKIECRVSAPRVLMLIPQFLAILSPVVVGHVLFHLLLPAGGIFQWIILGAYAIAVACALLICARQLLRNGAQVVVNENGIEDRRQKLGVVEWADIKQVSVREMHRAKFLAIDVADPEKYLSRMSRWNRWGSRSLVKHGYPPIAISFELLDLPLDQVFDFIQCNYREYVRE